MKIEDINRGASIKVTCRIVYYVNHGEIPPEFQGEVLVITDGNIENGALILKKGVVENGCLIFK